LVESSVEFARTLGVSELIIGLTVIAIGTSLPEIATSVLASMRGKGDIAVGNVVGSNLFNMLSVIGATAAVSPHGIAVPDEALRFDLPIMIGVIVMTLPIFYTGLRISRLEGSLFLGYYVLYTAWLFLMARKSDDLDIYAAVMLWFVIPLTVLTLGFFYVRALVARHRRRST
jgi:cation:H+ antiporter